ncbi:MAG: 5'-methylthioadenosine/adenosylhomocysteine nucleosidase [Oscillospiraceae bacterium]|nr:5'-methylthioadenosine/adenosylhomocysteine nucleosidase [Oscillospiraceae bacterium]
MRWGIIAALDAELELILDAMETESTLDAYGVRFHIGKIAGQEVAAVCSSVGTINAAACASVLTRELGATALVNIGVAGSTCEELDILDVVLSSEVVFHDADTAVLKKYYPYRENFTADAGLIELAEKSIAALKGRGFGYKVGRIATGDLFVDSLGAKNDIIARVNPLCVEMEGAAIGQIAQMSGIPFLIIRSLSDKSDGSAALSFESFLGKAAANSAAIVLGIIKLQNS